MRFSTDFIEKVREANNIVEIIGQHTELKGSGHRLMGRCPFPDHSDKSPSFSVGEDNQLYFCYGCKKGGNLFTFLETFNGMNFPEAVEYLARRASIPLPEADAREKRTGLSSDQKDLYLKINKAAAVYFHHMLKEQPLESPAQKYLVKRGLTEEIVEKFRLGLSSDEWQGLGRMFESRGVPLNAAEALGLLKPKKNAPRPAVEAPDTPGQPSVQKASGARAEHYFDLFRERLMFPIFSPTGDVVGFGGRTLTDALPKYVNSSDSPVFNKSKILYGLHETGKFIRAQDEAIVVEGYMDAISLYAAGIKNVVAVMGTAFTPEHAKLLKRYTLNVKMLLDGDEAGINGAERSLPVLLEAGMMPKGFVLPDKMDPDDYVKQNGVEALRREIDRAPELFTLLLTKRWMSNYHGMPSEKVQVVEEAAHALKAMPNRQLLDLYVLEMSRQLDIDMPWIRRALSQSSAAVAYAKTQHPQGTSAQPGGLTASGPRPVGAPRPVGSPPPARMPTEAEVADAAQAAFNAAERLTEAPPVSVSLKGAPKEESFILSLLLHNEVLMKDLIEAGPQAVTSILSHEGIIEVVKRATGRYRQEPAGFSNLAAQLTFEVDLPAVLACSLAMVPMSSGTTDVSADEERVRKVMGDYMKAISTKHLKNQAKKSIAGLKDSPSEEAMQAFMELQRNRMKPQGKGD